MWRRFARTCGRRVSPRGERLPRLPHVPGWARETAPDLPAECAHQASTLRNVVQIRADVRSPGPSDGLAPAPASHTSLGGRAKLHQICYPRALTKGPRRRNVAQIRADVRSPSQPEGRAPAPPPTRPWVGARNCTRSAGRVRSPGVDAAKCGADSRGRAVAGSVRWAGACPRVPHVPTGDAVGQPGRAAQRRPAVGMEHVCCGRPAATTPAQPGRAVAGDRSNRLRPGPRRVRR